MGRIRLLPDLLCNQIAAGEVIERPAAIVKELVENSIDARSNTISIILERGGKKLVEIVDSGEGMDREDAILAVERHATSKIASIDDLHRIASLGFRGEALASIAAVSRMRIVTKTEDEEIGTEVLIEGGVVRAVNDVGCPVGCRITVRDVFFNVPARRRFLKTDTTEQNHIIDIVQKLALAHPEIHFRLSSGSRLIFEYPRVGNEKEQPQSLKDTVPFHLKARIAQVLGWDVSKCLYEFSHELNGCVVHGFIGSPDFTFPKPKIMYVFVNGRSVRDTMVQKAVRDAYNGYIPHQEYPAAIIFLRIPPDLVDVNVHPTKREVRFRAPHQIKEIVAEGVRIGIASIETSRRSSIAHMEKPSTEMSLRDNMFPGDVAQQYDIRCEERSWGSLLRRPEEIIPQEAPEENAPFSSLHVLDHLNGVYLVCKSHSDIVLIDVHAAHERIIYNKLSNLVLPLPSQMLFQPIMTGLTPEEVELLDAKSEALRLLGYDVDLFDSSTAVIRSVPSPLPHCDHGAVVKDLIKAIHNAFHKSALIEALIKSVACHSAIRGKTELHDDEIQWLLKEMDKHSEMLTCPHGRPAWIKLSQADIHRLFKRS